MFTQKQIDELQKNKDVVICSQKSITYRKEFRLEAVKKYYEEGHSPRMIFEEAGFDIGIIGKDRAKDSLLRWRRIYNNKGEEELIKATKGGYQGKKTRKKIKHKNNQEKIEYLEAKVKYLEVENCFLAKLRGLKRE